MNSDLYQERVLDSPAVCSNCFRTVRVERVDPTRGGLTREFEAHYEREKRQTTIEYAPAETVSAQKGVFCQCGVEGSYERVWDDADVDRERFKAFVQHAIAAVERQGVALNRQRVAATALAARDGGEDVDTALREGISAGLSSRTSSEEALTA